MLRIFVFAFLVAILLVLLQQAPPKEAYAQGGCGSVQFSCNLKPVFREESNECGGNLLSALKSYTCETSYEEVYAGEDEEGNALWSCEEAGTSVVAGPHYTTPTLYFTCGDYRRPNAYSPDEDGGGWYEQATCECSGSCYPAPETKEVSDPSLDPANVLDDSDLPKLPVNLGWKDNVKKLVEDLAPGYACPIGSYKYEVTGNGKTVTGLELENLEDIVGQCQLTPSKSYEWRAQACLDEEGEDCGAWSEKGSFSTSDAPELLSPFDSDFEGDGDALAPIPSVLEWCSAPGGSSYQYRIFEALGEGMREILRDTTLKTVYDDGGLFQILNKGVRYFWEVLFCAGGSCGTPSQFWSFTPSDFTLQVPVLRSPRYIQGSAEPVVNVYDSLAWTGSLYAQVYLVRIMGPSGSSDVYRSLSPLNLQDIWGKNLALNTSYSWRVAACTGESEDECQKTELGTTAFSETWRFTTTGAPPGNLRALPEQSGSVGIPTTLDWNDVPGAASYRYQVSRNASFTDSVVQGSPLGGASQVTIEDILRQNTQYWWRVRTCADQAGSTCGSWSQISFRTATLSPPQIPTGQTLLTPSSALSWEDVFGANFYTYELTYAALGSEETSSLCTSSLGKVTDTGTVNGSSALLPLSCAGTFTIRIQGCTDRDCQDAGPWSQQQSFQVQEPPVSRGIYGLVPCGVGTNNPNTPWDERESCGFGHALLLVRNLIDFALWKLSLIIIAIMAIATGAMIYFSFGGPDLFSQIKSVWKAVGVGVLILLFSWMLLNILLGFIGFDVSAFGQWYEVPLQ